MSQSSYVTPSKIEKVEDEKWGHETVKFIARCSAIKSKFRAATKNFNQMKGWPRLVATDQRIFIQIPQVLDTKVESFKYETLSQVSLDAAGGSETEISLQTVRGKTYIFEVDEPGDAEIKEMVDYVQRSIAKKHRSQGEAGAATAVSASATKKTNQETKICADCGEDVSVKIDRCPNCGFTAEDYNKWFYIHATLAAIFGVTGMGLVLLPLFMVKMAKHKLKYWAA